MTTWHYCVVGRPVSSTNSQQIVKAGGRRLVLKSKAQRRWRQEALVQLTEQRGRRRAIAEPCAVTLHVFRQTNAGDVDSTVKGVLDAMEQAGILENDRYVDELHVYRLDDPKRPRIEIAISLQRGQST